MDTEELLERARRQVDALNHTEKRLKDRIASSTGDERAIAQAGLAAFQGSVYDKLVPSRDEDGELIATTRQGNVAACHAREDAAMTYGVVVHLLGRIRELRALLWVVVGLLAYIAYRVS